MSRNGSSKQRVIWVGVDPGVAGGMAVINNGTTTATKVPATERDLWAWFLELKLLTLEHKVVAVLEQVGGYVSRDKGVPGMGPSMFSFGVCFGRLRMGLVAAGIEFATATPQTWQGELAIGKRTGEKSTTFKSRMADLARDLFPGIIVTKATSDALLLAHFCRRRYPRGL